MKRRILGLFLLVMICFASIAQPSSAASVVDTKISEIQSMFPNGSYFTVNGSSCTHAKESSCNNCKLGNIMSSKVPQYASFFSGARGERWTCYSFATFAFYHIWGHEWTTNTTTVSYANAQKGDFVVFGNNAHYGIFISPGVVMDANGLNANTVGEVTHNNVYPFRNFSNYTIYRSTTAPESSQSDYVNLGNKFNASIFRTDHWVTLLSDSATLGTSGRTAKGVWTFERQSNGAYIITSMYDGKVLDVYGAGTSDGTKVWTCDKWVDSSGSNAAQEWYIYTNGSGYRFVPRLVPNKCMTCNNDSYGPKTGMNLQAWITRPSQVFSVYKQTEIFPTGISTSNVTVKVGETAKVPYTISPSNTNSKYVGATFSSSNTNVVTVDSDGTVKGISPGTAYVTVTMSFNDRKSVKAKITVEKADCQHNSGVNYVLVKKATMDSNGSKSKYCNTCGAKIGDVVIKKIASTELSYYSKTYTGDTLKAPTITVLNSDGKILKEGTDYEVEGLNDQESVGRYEVTISFTGDYDGIKNLYYTITPKAPANAKATLTRYYSSTSGYDDVKFSWEKSTGASGYYVYYKKSTSSSYTYLTRTTKTYVYKKNLTDGVKYNFKVIPYYEYEETREKSSKCKTASVYTLKKLSTPTLSKSGTKVKVKWKNISGETGYQISKSTSKTGTSIVSTYKTTSGTYKTVKATKGKTYYYKVRAYKEVDGKKIYGPWSSVKSYKRK